MGIYEERVTKGVCECIEDMYKEESTRVKSLCGDIEDFIIRVRMHQCLDLNAYLF